MYMSTSHEPISSNEKTKAFRLSQGRKLRKGAPGKYFGWDITVPTFYTPCPHVLPVWNI